MTKVSVSGLLLLIWGSIGWVAGSFIEQAAAYREAERLQRKISVAGRDDPQLAVQAMDETGKLAVRSANGDPVIIVNKHFQLRLNPGRTFPWIERLGTHGAERNVKD